MKLRILNLFIIVFTVMSLLTVSSCSRKVIKVVENDQVLKEKNKKADKTDDPVLSPLIKAENDATEAGKAILEIGRKMVFDEKAIIKGSCWDYINEVYKRAGYGTNKKTVYKSKKSGPFVNVSEIQPGDWLYYVNYSYGGVEHSGIFVYWKDFDKKIGVTLSYGGEQRNEPGRYREYDLKSVYNIIRPGE